MARSALAVLLALAFPTSAAGGTAPLSHVKPMREATAVIRSLRFRPVPTPPKPPAPVRTHLSASTEPSKRKVRLLIRKAAKRWGVDPDRMLRTAECESGLNPRATSPSGLYRGLFQHHNGYWPRRAGWAGLSGASIYNPWANAYVSAKLIRRSGWHHWPVCGASRSQA